MLEMGYLGDIENDSWSDVFEMSFYFDLAGGLVTSLTGFFEIPTVRVRILPQPCIEKWDVQDVCYSA